MDPLFHKAFKGVIWSSILSNTGASLILDVRDSESKSIKYCLLNLETFEYSLLKTPEVSWWSMLEAFDASLYISEYQDTNDPNNKKFYRLEKSEQIEIEETEIPLNEKAPIQPTIFEPESSYFNTVSDFLSLELACSSEYLEFNNKIIMSYYLRSDKTLDRHLLVLADGKKIIKEVQDNEMAGFASGAFFVHDNKLFFVKGRNEIFIYAI